MVAVVAPVMSSGLKGDGRSVKMIKVDVTKLPVAMSSAVFLAEMPASSCGPFTASCPNA